MEPKYRLFIDEVGHSNLRATEHPNEQYLSLTGVIMPLAYARGTFAERLDAMKREIFTTSNIVLHRTDMIYRRPPFECLHDEILQSRLDQLLLDWIATSTYRVITVVIDKIDHKKRYLVWQAHPYHYCLIALMERYVMWLKKAKAVGDVMAESRGKKDNRMLMESYERMFRRGTDYISANLFQQSLTTRKLKIEDKRANNAALQLADLIANPSMRSIICENKGVAMEAAFGTKIVEILKKSKYRRSPAGIISGYGTKWLP